MAKLLQALYTDCAGYLDLRALKKGSPPQQSFFLLTDSAGITSWIKQHRGTHDLYFGVSTRDGKGGKKSNIVSIPAVWLDMDFKTIPGGEQEAQKIIDAFIFKPTIMIHSGGGFHIYYKFKEPEGPEQIDRAEAVMRGLAIRLQGDMASTDASRILRIPNTRNYKYKPDRPVRIIYANGAEYSLSDFDDFADSAPTPKRHVEYTGGNSERLDKIMSCRFMQHWMNDAATLSEPEWYRGLTQLIRDPGGVALIHKYSKRYPKYSQRETNDKIAHAANSTGPMTCENIFKDTGFVCEDPDCRAKAPAGRGLIENDPSPYDDTLEHVSGVSGVSGVSKESNGKQTSASVSNGKQEGASESDKNGNEALCDNNLKPKSSHETVGADVSNGKQSSARNVDPQLGGITAQLREWIKDSIGSFTVQDVDREFNLRSRTEKNARSRALNKILTENTIIRDRVVKGKYHIMDTQVEWDDRNQPYEECYPIKLPLGLDEMVLVPPKSIIMVAGTTNAGKTAFLFNTARLNLHGKKQLVYIRSEMSSGEYFSRQDLFKDVTAQDWSQMKSTERPTGFNSVIWNHNKDGITFVDFLEDIGGEFGKMPAGIREIYDSLGNGVAMIAIQKKTGQDYGRGGEGTAEKARLYIAIDKLLDCEKCVVCSVRIIKAKIGLPKGMNHSGKEIHFKLSYGTIMEKLSEWDWINEKQRNMLLQRYRNAFGQREERPIVSHV